ncbi:putative intergrin alpha chain protein [Trypanosoma rangeli]|uniref:Putative intergrin alpha chain protein n=1 Tax=Trypanosoma rangeli TaxID=5698 RepID=A0A3R7KWB9_TRYRA|nr:putative intergrin alpha chain protein [Trypanosoma rangeli]RNF10969.1 putative intergrin alpha chain protein [Trypanosoma rangeli]|eukprot:RNF10969.1 putative intergrin alpha chain protein [Trypanosoma rangeli]
MRLRDILIVCVAIIFCIFGWSQEGGLTVRRNFKIPVSDVEITQYVMSRPVVSDLMGDGRPVLLASTSYGILEAFKTHLARGNSENVFLTVRSGQSRNLYARIVAIAVGKLSRTGKENAIVVVTDDFRLRRLSPHDLTEIWDVSLSGVWVETYHASVSIVPERIHKQDEGTVLVAIRVTGPNATELMLYAAFNGADGQVRWRYTSDADNSIQEVLGGACDNETECILADNVTSLRRNAIVKSQEVRNQFRAQEKPWTFYREAIITLLPHHYSHPWDEHIHPHVFFHSKNRKKRSFRAGNRVVVKYKDRLIRMNKEDYGALGEKLGRMNLQGAAAAPVNKSRPRAANAMIFHGKNSIEVIHLYTGSVITRLAPLKSAGVYYHDINDDFQVDAVGTQIGPRVEMHSRHGVDLLDDCLGVIHTGIPVAEDRLFNATICDTEGFFGRLDLIHHFIDGDVRGEEAPHALNTLELIGSRNVVSKKTRSVTPIVVQLHTMRGRDLFQVERHAVFLIDTGLVTCVDPSRRRVMWRTQTDATFYGLREAAEADAGTAGLSAKERMHRAVTFPHLAAYSFYQSQDDSVMSVSGSKRYLHTDPFIIALGERYMSILGTRNGRVLRTIELESPPVAPVIVRDFNGDGINDIIVVTKEGIYGFAVGTQTSSETITALMLLMVTLLAVLFVVREISLVNENNTEFLPTCVQDMHQPAQKVSRRATD